MSESFSNLLDEVAGSLTRNNVPNYGYVGRTARALRPVSYTHLTLPTIALV